MISGAGTERVALLAQYPIGLPADYDMDIIRRRVCDRGAALDHRDGLTVKAYAVTERGVDGAAINSYAPFYLWGSTRAAAHFHYGGGGFAGIVSDFGRPSVRTWLPVAARRGGLPAARVDTLELREWLLAPDVDPAGVAEWMRAEVRSGDDEMHWTATGIDVTAWRAVLIRTTARGADAWPSGASAGAGDAALAAPASEADTTRYRVLHVSEPAGHPDARPLPP
nr:DUF4865 family protein [Nakamurella aerolata]